MALRVIELVEHPGTPKAWDRLIAADARGHLLQTWAWGTLKERFGWHAVRLGVERDGALVGGAQVLYRSVGPLSLGYVPKGPVLAEPDAAVCGILWEALDRFSKSRRAISLKVEPEWYDEEADRRSWLVDQGLRPHADCVQPRRTIMVDLEPDDEAMLARMKPKWRYNVRLAARKGVQVHETGPEGMHAFYELMRVTGARDRFAIHSHDYYRAAYELFAPAERATLLLATLDGEPLAALMPFAFGSGAWYMFGASSNAHRETMPNHLLQWEAMRWARERGSHTYDLWGIPDLDEDSPTQDLDGVGRFKAGFGGRVVRYVGAYERVYIRPLHTLMQRALDWRRRL